MRPETVVIALEDQSWRKGQDIWVRGSPFLGTHPVGPERMKEWLSRAVIGGELQTAFLKGLLSELRGFFAVVWHIGDYIVLVSDIVRTYPLFLDTCGASLVIRDRLQRPDVHSDLVQHNVMEFALTGFVTGEETLFEGALQIQAGEALVYSSSSRHLKRIPYFAFTPAHPSLIRDIHSADGFIQNIDASLSLATERLVSYLNGRVAVVPLSGGWDSRTVLLHLKKRGYPRLLAFTYGTEGNEEAVISRKVAEQLGVKWVFVPYRLEDWRRFSGTDNYRGYLEYAHNGVSAPHIQDLLAIDTLVRLGVLVPGDSVVVPGHSADFVAGSHLEPTHGFINDIENLVEAIWAKHYCLALPSSIASYAPHLIRDWQNLLSQLRHKLKEQILQSFEQIPFADPHSFLDFWNWRERQAKFIVNSVRVYEYHRLDVWLPLWDYDFVSLWQSVPLEWRMYRKLYRIYLVHLQKELNLNLPVLPRSRLVRQQLRTALERMRLRVIANRLRDFVAAINPHAAYVGHPMQWYGIWAESDFSKLFTGHKGKININTLVVIDVLRRLYSRENP